MACSAMLQWCDGHKYGVGFVDWYQYYMAAPMLILNEMCAMVDMIAIACFVCFNFFIADKKHIEKLAAHNAVGSEEHYDMRNVTENVYVI